MRTIEVAWREVIIETVYAFIDSQNLNLGVKNDIVDKNTQKLIYKGWDLSFPRFRKYLSDKYKVSKAFLFIGKVKGNEGLYKVLTTAGYTLIFKPITYYVDGIGELKIKGNVDAELVLQTIIEINNYDSAVIVAGDGDYRCLIEYLLEKKN